MKVWFFLDVNIFWMWVSCLSVSHRFSTSWCVCERFCPPMKHHWACFFVSLFVYLKSEHNFVCFFCLSPVGWAPLGMTTGPCAPNATCIYSWPLIATCGEPADASIIIHPIHRCIKLRQPQKALSLIPTYKSTTLISNFSNCFVTSYLMHLRITPWIAFMMCILTFDSRCMVIVRLVPHLKALPLGFLGGAQMNLRQARAFSGQSHAQG